MAGNIEVDLDDFMGKEFTTFRKTKVLNEGHYQTKYNFVNLFNKHFVQKQEGVLELVSY
jgi:hypothetical protein